MDDKDAVAKTMSLEMIPIEEGQPILNPDGSLLLPGARSAIPGAVVATMKDTPALVAIVHGKPGVFPLEHGKRFILGRDKASSIVLADMSVSRKHAEAFPGPDGFYIRDLASSNGVLVNQTRIDNPYRLSSGDRITIGNILLYFFGQGSQFPQIVGPGLGSFQGRAGTARAAAPPPGPKAEVQQIRLCRNCGSVSNGVARFCQSCGAPL